MFWLFNGLLAAAAGPSQPAWNAQVSGGKPARQSLAWAVACGAAAWLGFLAVPALVADRHVSMGDFYHQGNFLSMAEGAYEASLDRRPADAFIHYQLAFVLDKEASFDWTGRLWDRSLHHYEEARRLGLNDERLFAQMAMLYERKGKMRRSVEFGSLALSIYPESADHLANLAYWTFVCESGLAESLALINRALVAVPDHPLYCWTRALIREKMHAYREAVRDLNTALLRLPMVPNGVGLYSVDLRNDLARLQRLAAPSR